MKPSDIDAQFEKLFPYATLALSMSQKLSRILRAEHEMVELSKGKIPHYAYNANRLAALRELRDAMKEKISS